jgi:hypothetical protein
MSVTDLCLLDQSRKDLIAALQAAAKAANFRGRTGRLTRAAACEGPPPGPTPPARSPAANATATPSPAATAVPRRRARPAASPATARHPTPQAMRPGRRRPALPEQRGSDSSRRLSSALSVSAMAFHPRLAEEPAHPGGLTGAVGHVSSAPGGCRPSAPRPPAGGGVKDAGFYSHFQPLPGPDGVGALRRSASEARGIADLVTMLAARVICCETKRIERELSGRQASRPHQ